MLKYIQQKAQDDLFSKFAVNVEVFLRGSKTKGACYDKYRDVGYVKNIFNPIFVKAIKRNLSPNSLVYREIGLAEVGAVELTVKNDDVLVLRASEKVRYNNDEYYAYNEALGNKFQVYPSTIGYSRVILFKKNM